jgi:hypothetical protein
MLQAIFDNIGAEEEVTLTEDSSLSTLDTAFQSMDGNVFHCTPSGESSRHTSSSTTSLWSIASGVSGTSSVFKSDDTITSGTSTHTESDRLSRKPKKKSQTISRFLDSVSEAEVENITKKLSQFFYGCNIPFSVVESDSFRSLIKALRPAYEKYVPNRRNLSTNLLDSAYEDILAVSKGHAPSDSVLLIDGWKNSSSNKSTVVAMLHNSSGPRLFLDSWDISDKSETGVELARVVDEACEEARVKYNSNVYHVVSDSAANMKKMGREVQIWQSNCHSHWANLLAKDLIPEELNKKVVKIAKEFKIVELENALLAEGGKKSKIPIDVRWCSYRDTYKNFLENLSSMRRVACGSKEKKIKKEVRDLLFNNEFVEEVERFLELFNPICELINVCQKSDILRSPMLSICGLI